MSIKTIYDLEAYRLAYSLAMDVFKTSVAFPKTEVYSLTDQIRRSSRSVAINIREGYAKRRYENVFIRHLRKPVGGCRLPWIVDTFNKAYLVVWTKITIT